MIKALLFSSNSSGWTIKDLSNYFYTKESYIVDPDGYLGSQIDSIQKNINQIKALKTYETFLFIINKMPSSYSTDIENYLNDLSLLVLRGDELRDHHSIFILYSIEDRKSRIRTGKNVRDDLSDTTCLDLQENIKSLMRSGKYSQAMDELISSIEKEFSSTFFQKILNKIYNTLMQILIYALIIGFLVIPYLTKKSYSSTEDRLKKIKKISESKKSKRQIIETTCVICLEPLEEEKDKIIENSEKNLNQLHCSDENIKKIELSAEREEEKIVEENKLEEIKNIEQNTGKKEEKEFVAKLECGHSFHSKCIVIWMAKQNKCPICRENIDKDQTDEPSKNSNNNSNTNQQSISQNLINIHSILDNNLHDFHYVHTLNQFSWNRRNNYQSSSSSSSSWGGMSGGASSSW